VAKEGDEEVKIPQKSFADMHGEMGDHPSMLCEGESVEYLRGRNL